MLLTLCVCVLWANVKRPTVATEFLLLCSSSKPAVDTACQAQSTAVSGVLRCVPEDSATRAVRGLLAYLIAVFRHKCLSENASVQPNKLEKKKKEIKKEEGMDNRQQRHHRCSSKKETTSSILPTTLFMMLHCLRVSLLKSTCHPRTGITRTRR